MKEVTIYTTRYCGFCVRAKQLLQAKSIAFIEMSVDGDNAARQDLAKRSGQRTVPQIWVGETYVGGCTELFALEQHGKLDAML
ncbi:MAG: glutaredoxin 3 [Flavobacteriales bacterium]|jgi:glutaredoxin 3